MESNKWMTNFPVEYEERGVVKFQFCITKQCNLKCPWCINARNDDSAMNRPVDPRRMDLVDIWSDDPNYRYTLAFSGGEPLLEPQEILSVINQLPLEKVKNFHLIEILTNGTIYDGDLIDKIEAINPKLVFHVSHKKMNFSVETKEIEAAQQIVDRIGTRAVWFPVITMNNYKDFTRQMERAYEMGYRRYNIRFDMTERYQYRFYDALEEFFKVVPKDFVLIQSHNRCRNNFHREWVNKNGRIDPECISFAPKSELNYDTSAIHAFFEETKLLSPKAKLKVHPPGREMIVMYLALKHSVPIISNQHSERWYYEL